jgi:micrococcal nuclease
MTGSMPPAMSKTIRFSRHVAAVVAFAAWAAPADAGQMLPGPYLAAVERVVDGDTLGVSVTVWLGQDLDVLVRVRGIDAPEIRGRCDSEKARSRAATTALKRLVSDGVVVLTRIEGGKYFGRVVADVATQAGVDVGAALLAVGHARAYDGGRRGSWCDDSVSQGDAVDGVARMAPPGPAFGRPEGRLSAMRGH